MKTVRSVADAQRLALSRGASMQLEGRNFNAGGAKVATKPKPKPAPPVAAVKPEPKPEPIKAAPPKVEPPKPEPKPAPMPGTITRADVERIIAERDAKWSAELSRLTAAFAVALKEASAKPAPTEQVKQWAFNVRYAENGAIKTIDAKAV